MMPRLRNHILRILVLSVLPFTLRAQHGFPFRVIDDSTFMLGVQSSLVLSWHTGSVATAPRPCECEFRDGSGTGLSFGVRGIMPLHDNVFLRAGLSLERLGGEFKNTRSALPMLGERHRVELVDFDDRLTVRMDVVSLELLGGWSFVPEGLYVIAGPVLSYVLDGRFTQNEYILTPGVFFLDGSSETTLVDTAPPGMRPMLVSLRLGAGAIFDVSPQVVLSPDIAFSVPLQRITPGESWRIGGFFASMSAYLRLPR